MANKIFHMSYCVLLLPLLTLKYDIFLNSSSIHILQHLGLLFFILILVWSFKCLFLLMKLQFIYAKNKIVNKLHFMDEISISGMNLFHPKISWLFMDRAPSHEDRFKGTSLRKMDRKSKKFEFKRFQFTFSIIMFKRLFSG